jgi:hypothetical protein
MALRLRRGTDAERLLITPVQGELIYTTDTKKLYIGDGTTVGGQIVEGAGSPDLAGLTDINVAGAEDGQLLAYNSATLKWEASDLNGVVQGSNYQINITGSDSSTIVNAETLTITANVVNGELFGDSNGTHTGDVWWMAHETRSIRMVVGDYQWVNPTNGKDEILYMSSPSSIDGNWRDIPTDIPVALDLAYVGSTKIKKLDLPSNVEYVFYSLSKSFGVRNVRTGWMFTRKKDLKLDALTYNAKYYNYYALQVSEAIIKYFNIDYVHSVYQDQQAHVCQKLNIVASDSVWIATSTDPIYEQFRRNLHNARLCLAGVYNEKTTIT